LAAGGVTDSLESQNTKTASHSQRLERILAKDKNKLMKRKIIDEDWVEKYETMCRRMKKSESFVK